MKVVSSAEVMQTVEIDTLAEIPSERQIIQAISVLYIEKEKNSKNYVYIKFPFGKLCYEGLKELISYYERIQFQEKINEDRNLLNNVKSICSQLKIDVNKIEEHLKDHVWNSKSPVLN